MYDFIPKTKHYVLFCFENIVLRRTKERFMLDIKGFMRYNLRDKKGERDNAFR